MDQKSLYEEISVRTGGDVYIGVVGPGAHRQIDVHQKVHGDHGHPGN